MKFTFLLLLFSIPVWSAETKPKYGPETQVLSRDHSYIQKHAASDFWALMPYYTAQQDDASCSLASATMLINAARTHRGLTSDDQLATQPQVLSKSGNEDWKKALGPLGHGVSLDQLKDILTAALKAYSVEVASIEVFHVSDTEAKTEALLHQTLVENEKSDKDFIIANFNQGVFTGDAEAGHIAPVGAYDAKNKRVLILDPDRKWYEPYWVSEKTFMIGMATRDSSSKVNRGYIWIRLK